jgi:murein DD-endopeptidase MepM/ murein hydrolase activator NlpD
MTTRKFLVMLFAIAPAANSLTQRADLCGSTWENSAKERFAVLASIQSLQKTGVVPLRQGQASPFSNATLSTTSAIRFQWPMASHIPKYFDPYLSKNFIDLDTSAGLRDYNGGDHTYNGHNGMDVMIGPYYWEMMRNEEVLAVAAAPGIIVIKRDGGFDGNCSWDNPEWVGVGPSGNYVALLHEDGHTVSYYKHLKNGSVTTLPVGQKVSAGTALGVVASSGRSTGPHLHFEVHVDYQDTDNEGTLIEPFYGPYNTSIGQSLWASQRAYVEPEVLGMESYRVHHTSYPPWYEWDCDSVVLTGGKSLQFQPGDHIKVRAFFRDWPDGTQISGALIDPNGNIFKLWLWSNPEKYRFAYNIHSADLPANAVSGIWSFTVAFNGKTYAHYFKVGSCPATQNLSGTHTNNVGYIVSGTISSTSTISGNAANMVQYKADQAVVLSPGFLAAKGCYFYANNQGCAAPHQ